MKILFITSLACCCLFLLPSCNESSAITDSTAATAPGTLVVNRLDPLHQTDKGFNKTIQDPAAVKKLYELLLSLPPFPQDMVHCPVDNGVQYELTFTLTPQNVTQAIVSATGCQAVTRHETTYWAMEPKGNGFRTSLEQALGLTDAEFRVGFASRN